MSSSVPSGGVGGTTFGALSSIGSDLSVSVSFNIARELLDAAHDEQISEDELIGLVLGFAIVFTALQSRIEGTLAKRRIAAVEHAKKAAQSRFDRSAPVAAATRAMAGANAERDALVRDEFVEAAGRAAVAKLADRRSMLDFLYLLVSICQRICVAISIQLLAASVRAQQPSRLVRTVSLVALAAFFVFVESLTTRVLV